MEILSSAQLSISVSLATIILVGPLWLPMEYRHTQNSPSVISGIQFSKTIYFRAMFRVRKWICLVLNLTPSKNVLRLPRWLSDKESAWQCRWCRFNPWVRKIPWRRKWQPTPVFLPRKSHGQRNLVGYSSWGCEESDTTEHTHTRMHKVQTTFTTKLPHPRTIRSLGLWQYPLKI